MARILTSLSKSASHSVASMPERSPLCNLNSQPYTPPEHPKHLKHSKLPKCPKPPNQRSPPSGGVRLQGFCVFWHVGLPGLVWHLGAVRVKDNKGLSQAYGSRV